QRHRRNPRRDHEDRRVVDAAQGRRCIARIARNGSPAPRVRRRWSLRGRGLRAPPRPAPGRLDRRRLEEWASLTGGARARAQSARPRGGRARAGSGAPGAPTLASHRGAHVNLRTVCALTARLLFLMGAFQLFPLALAVLDRSEPAIRAYALSAVVCALTAYVLRLIGKGAPTTLHRKDAFGVVTLTWFSISLLGAIPFVVEGSIPNVLSAIFEAVSGFTTGGSTVITDVDALSRATNLWRCLMHWIGGMGIVVLFVAVFPQLGVGAKQLFRAEVAGPITEGLRPRIKQTALALWWIYTGLTIACCLLLLLFGMPLFDAVCHAMSTLSAGGFSTKTTSVNAFTNPGIDWTLCVFMLIAGLNFGLYYGAVRGRWRDLVKNYVLRFYLLVNLILIAILFFSIREHHPEPATALRIASFQATSMSSTTGFTKEDYDQY